MAEQITSLVPVYKSWEGYQQHLKSMIEPLSAEQLTLRVAPHLRSVNMLANHIIAVRMRWFHGLMGQGGDEADTIASWDRGELRGELQIRSAAELVNGLNTTWQVLQDSLSHWKLANLQDVFEGERYGESYRLTREWVIWHVLEHDIHHGGELSLTLGAHHIPVPDL